MNGLLRLLRRLGWGGSTSRASSKEAPGSLSRETEERPTSTVSVSPSSGIGQHFETLGEAQREFTRCIGELIVWAYSNGYELTFGDAWGDPNDGRHMPNSNHYIRLAVDFNLFVGGVYQRASEAHRPLGEFWKGLHPQARWGGDFAKKDGNHYSFFWKGIQ